jgi:acylphosphatase
MKRGAHAFVSGQVQGVGYRYYVNKLARRYNLTGWVRNLSDGRVEIMAEGEERELQDFIAEVKKGSRWSTVADVQTEWLNYERKFRSFEITG